MVGIGRWMFAAVLLAACGGPSGGAQAQSVVICPAGSVLDPQKQQCVAMEGVKPVVVADANDTPPQTDVHASTGPIGIADPPPPPPGTGFAIDVRCNFSQGWVTLLPASRYPKDDQFLMQSLIGLTKEPSFWSGAEYRPLQPYAAKRCSGAGTRLMAPTAGDYYLLVGEEGTFSLRGTYDKNGVRRKMTVNASSSVVLTPADLTHTWVCISCPWIVFKGENGHDLAPFVVLANRRGRGRRGSDVHTVAHVPVAEGRITLRVMEIEEEETHLDALVLRVNGRVLETDARSAIAHDDGKELVLRPHTQVTMSYAVPGITTGFVDVELEATGHYDLL